MQWHVENALMFATEGYSGFQVSTACLTYTKTLHVVLLCLIATKELHYKEIADF